MELEEAGRRAPQARRGCGIRRRCGATRAGAAAGATVGAARHGAVPRWPSGRRARGHPRGSRATRRRARREPGAELAELELRILRHDDALDLGDAPASPSAACPYRGLQPFGVETRTSSSDVTPISRPRWPGSAAALPRRVGRLGQRQVLVVRAGVVPALQRRGDRVVILTPEHDLDARIREGRGRGEPTS